MSTDQASLSARAAPRRSSSAVHAALLAAAGEVFARKGYAGASTKEIAIAARCGEASIYRRFGSKSELFTAAVLDPFFAFITEFEAFFETVIAEDGLTDEALVGECVRQLFTHLRRNQTALRALITAQGDPESEAAAREAIRRLDDFFHRMNEIGRRRSQRSDNYDVSKLPLYHRFFTGLIFDVTALDPWFLPHSWNRPTDDELIETLTGFILYGFIGQPPAAR